MAKTLCAISVPVLWLRASSRASPIRWSSVLAAPRHPGSFSS